MKTTVITSEKENGAVKNTSIDKSAIRPAVPLKNANQQDKEKPKSELETANSKNVEVEQPKEEAKAIVIVEAPKAEPTKI